MSYQKIKGTQDFYKENMIKLKYVESKMAAVIKNFGYDEIKTPTFEYSDVFIKNVGEGSDVVSKEMYTFLDKGNRSITLRPEGTAAVARFFIENKLYANPGLTKFYYFEPMFRYERPQVGRYREFHQFGVEVYGNSSYLLDVDVILSAYQILSALNIQGIKLRINSIGDALSRQNYSKSLKKYFSKYIDSMCPDCHRRLEINPMRILDCKVDCNSDIIKNAPKIHDYLTEESLDYFNKVTDCLKEFDINFEIDYNLVRGLDYYTDIVFEFIIESNDSYNQLALGGGGRYANMIKDMIGVDVPGIGYAFGVDRIIGVMENNDLFPRDIFPSTDVVIISLDMRSKTAGIMLANNLRQQGIIVEMDYLNCSMKSQFKLCDRLNPKYIIIIGEDELKTNEYIVKNTKNKTQEKVEISKIYEYLRG